MRRALLLFFVFLLLGVGLAVVFRDHNGYVLLAYEQWQVETSLVFFVVALLVGFWALLLLWRLLSAGVLLPQTVRRWRAARLERKAKKALNIGLVRMLEGRWAEAEDELARLAERGGSPLVHYLMAARVAQQRGAVASRDRYLEKAAACRDSSELAVLLTQAELQMQQSQPAEALATLSRLRQLDPSHPRVLELMVSLCRDLEEWHLLKDVLPAAAKAGVLDRKRLQALTVEVWAHVLHDTEADAERLTAAWRQVPRHARDEPDLALAYACRLHDAGADDPAADHVRRVLKKAWHPELAMLFGELHTEDKTAQLASVEEWLKEYGDEPELLLVAGRLCLRNRLWGRARSYFESSLKGQARPEVWLELGRLFEEIEEADEARRVYRQGLDLAVGSG